LLISFTAPLWLWNGKAAWHFVTLPADQSGMIRMAVPKKAGFGSVKVKATIGGSSWRTSIFPDSKTGTYLLPVKGEVRKAEGLASGDTLSITLSLDAG